MTPTPGTSIKVTDLSGAFSMTSTLALIDVVALTPLEDHAGHAGLLKDVG